MRTILLALTLAACSNAANPAADAPPTVQPDAPGLDGSSPPTGLQYTGGTYSNHFDGLPSAAMSAMAPSQTVTGRGPFGFDVLTGTMATTGMDGWQFANPTGSSMDTELRAHDGSQSGSAGRGLISYGTDGSTQRALGSLATSNQIPVFGLVVVNGTTGTLHQVMIGFTGEQWRRGTVTTADSLTVDYGVASAIDATTLTTDADLTFASPNVQATPTDVALDGTAAANKQLKSKTLTGLTWDPGTALVVRFTASSGTGHDDGLAIDDFTLSAAP